MSKMKDAFRSLNTVSFIFCLGILLLNDFYLKTAYPNWLTGKLSDFSGLYIFASFFAALFSNQKRLVYWVSGFLFVLWKSPYSQSFIDFFSLNLYPIQRVEDITDLIALTVLPLAYLSNQKHRFRFSLNPIPLALLSILAFCATSVPRPMQTFEQPQYILFKSGIVDFRDIDSFNEYYVNHADTFVIIEVKRIILNKMPSIDDEFHKVQVLKILDLLVVKESLGSLSDHKDISEYESMRDSLRIERETSITLKKDSLTDHLVFQNSRLHGTFQRFINNKLTIEGFFKNGIEDSVWTFYNNHAEILTKKSFHKGELVKTESFENSILQSERRFNTRDESLRNKYFHVAILFSLILGLMWILYTNFKKSGKENIKPMSHFSKIAGSLVLPIIILIIAKIISSLIPNSYSTENFGIIGECILVQGIVTPLLLFIFYVLKLRNRFDFLFYILLLSLGVVFIEESLFLNNLLN